MEIDQEAQEERGTVTPDDDFKSPSISDELLTQIKKQLQVHAKIKNAWLAEKVLVHYPESPVYIVAYTTRGLLLSQNALLRKITQSLQLPCDLFVVVKGGEYKKLAKKVLHHGEQIL
ncbi:MAG: Peptidase M48 Ste24p [Halothiobacillaceae bacterium]|nr:MAG: Peptidase M48 Ste24p [Halothiobacillaceae bacterium]